MTFNLHLLYRQSISSFSSDDWLLSVDMLICCKIIWALFLFVTATLRNEVARKLLSISNSFIKLLLFLKVFKNGCHVQILSISCSVCTIWFDLSFSLFVICSFCNLFCTSVAGYILTTFTCFQNNTLKEIQEDGSQVCSVILPHASCIPFLIVHLVFHINMFSTHVFFHRSLLSTFHLSYLSYIHDSLIKLANHALYIYRHYPHLIFIWFSFVIIEISYFSFDCYFFQYFLYPKSKNYTF